MRSWKEAVREGAQNNCKSERNPPTGLSARNNPVGASKTGDRSRFFRTKTKKRFQKKFPPANPCSLTFFLMEFQCRVSARACLSSPSLSAPLLSLALALCSRSLQLSLALLSPSLLPLSLLLPPPAPSPCAAPSPRLSRPRPSSPPRARRSGSQAAGGAGRGSAAEQRLSAAAAATRRRWWRGEALTGGRAPPPAPSAQPRALPRTDLLPRPETDPFHGLQLELKPTEAAAPSSCLDRAPFPAAERLSPPTPTASAPDPGLRHRVSEAWRG